MKRFIAALLCIIMVFGMTACEAGKKEPADTADPSGSTAKLSAENAAKAVLNTEHYSLSMAEFDFMFIAVYNDTISNWRNAYGDSYATQLKSVMGLDIYLPLKDQMLMDNSSSYLEYFIEQTKSEARTLLLLCEWADDNGITLSDTDMVSVESNVQSYVDAAEKNECTIADLLGDPMGIIDADVLRSYNEKNYIAIKAVNALIDSYEFSDEQIDEEFLENPKDHAVVDFLVYTFETSDSVSAETAKKSAEELASVKSTDDFVAYVENYYNNVLNAGKTSFTEFNAANLEMNNIKYYEDVEYLEWMFGEDAKEGECYIMSDEENSIYSVFCLVSAPGENEYYMKNVRHILFKTSSYDTSDECKAEAERVYDLFKENPSEEYFAELANEYSEDKVEGAEKTDGGLYTDVDYNQMVSEFESWTFDESRVEGDTGIIRTSYGYHIMYFSGNGTQVRTGHDSAKEALISANYGADLEHIENDHPITVDDEHLKKFDA